MTTNTITPSADVIFANSPSLYKGSGTIYDVDVAVNSSDLLLETHIALRSIRVATAGNVDLDVFTLSVNRDLTKTSETFSAINGVIRFIDVCATCLDQTNASDVSINANQLFGDVYVTKSDGI